MTGEGGEGEGQGEGEQEEGRIAGVSISTTAAAAAATKQRPIEGDCPICYEPLTPDGNEDGSRKKAKKAEAIVFCHACGNNVHGDCFGRWKEAKQSSGQKLTCVWCRAAWEGEGGGGDERGVTGRGGWSGRGRGGGWGGRGTGRNGSARGFAASYVNLSQYSDEGTMGLRERYPDTYQFIQE